MARDLRVLLFGGALAPRSRRLLGSWLIAGRTGAERLRAGLPAPWRAGDKTGSGGHATANDVAVLWPPQRRPIVVAAYYTASSNGPAAQNAVLRDVGRIVSRGLA
jgi:beta-lactamase class A